MPVRFKQAFKEVALWEDVVEAMDGKPYSLLTKAGIITSKIAEANKKGFFGEALSWRIYKATNGRVKLTPYAEVQSNLKQQALKAKNAEVDAS